MAHSLGLLGSCPVIGICVHRILFIAFQELHFPFITNLQIFVHKVLQSAFLNSIPEDLHTLRATLSMVQECNLLIPVIQETCFVLCFFDQPYHSFSSTYRPCIYPNIYGELVGLPKTLFSPNYIHF